MELAHGVNQLHLSLSTPMVGAAGTSVPSLHGAVQLYSRLPIRRMAGTTAQRHLSSVLGIVQLHLKLSTHPMVGLTGQRPSIESANAEAMKVAGSFLVVLKLVSAEGWE